MRRWSKGASFFIVAKFAIGLFLVIVGGVQIVSKTTYTFYWWKPVEGKEVQLLGGVLLLYGVYLMAVAVRSWQRTKTNSIKKDS